MSGSYGCGACISPCLLGPSATVGTSAGQAGVSRYEAGKVRSFEVARYQDVVEATRRAGNALSFHLEKEVSDEDQTIFEYADGKDKKITVCIEHRTDSLTYIQVDVGFFGSKGLALVMINQIIHEIARAGHYLQEWNHQHVI